MNRKGNFINITRKCIYYQKCVYADTVECLDIYHGCLIFNRNKEEAENPLKSRHYFKID